MFGLISCHTALNVMIESFKYLYTSIDTSLDISQISL